MLNEWGRDKGGITEPVPLVSPPNDPAVATGLAAVN